MGAHQVTDDGQGVAPGVELLHGLDAAVGDYPLALGAAIGIGHLIRRGLHPLPGEVIGQPTGPEFLHRGLAVEVQGPFAVLVIAGLDDPAVKLRGVLVGAQALCDHSLGLQLIGRIFTNDPEGVPKIHKYRIDVLFHQVPPCKIGSSRISRKRCTI